MSYLLAKHPLQGTAVKALFICSAGLLRSPTAAHWAAEHLGWNTRIAGLFYGDDLGWPVRQEMLDWADRVFVMTTEHEDVLLRDFTRVSGKLVNLSIQDNYAYRSPALIKILEDRFAPELREVDR